MTPDADRSRGSFMGLAVGDALGTTLEFSARDSGPVVTDIVGGGPFKLRPGQWTDDTSMALCLAESLDVMNGFDPVDQLERYVRWWKDGYLSSTGRCFDIGNTTARALLMFKDEGQPYRNPVRLASAGNGSLMRLAPVPIAFQDRPELAVRLCGFSSRTTHPATECVDACRVYGQMIVSALHGRTKDAVLQDLGSIDPDDLTPTIHRIAVGRSYLGQTRARIKSSGYVVDSFEAALWAFAQTDDFRSGALLAVNLGDDADTVGAIYGQLAGAFYGESGIPSSWTDTVHERDTLIRAKADRLFAKIGAFAPR